MCTFLATVGDDLVPLLKGRDQRLLFLLLLLLGTNHQKVNDGEHDQDGNEHPGQLLAALRLLLATTTSL
jgi:hypothetical protein